MVIPKDLNFKSKTTAEGVEITWGHRGWSLIFTIQSLILIFGIYIAIRSLIFLYNNDFDGSLLSILAYTFAIFISVSFIIGVSKILPSFIEMSLPGKPDYLLLSNNGYFEISELSEEDIIKINQNINKDTDEIKFLLNQISNLTDISNDIEDCLAFEYMSCEIKFAYGLNQPERKWLKSTMENFIHLNKTNKCIEQTGEAANGN